MGGAALVGAVINIVFLVQANYERAQFHFKMFPINRVAKIDFFLLFTTGVTYLAYPVTIMKSVSLIINQLISIRFNRILIFQQQQKGPAILKK